MSFEYSEANHLRHGWLKRTNHSDLYFVKIGACRRRPEPGFIEAQRAARLINEKAEGRPIVLCMSGGIDSECMALSFLAARVPFRVAIARFKDDLNLLDIQAAIEFCRRHDVEFEFLDYDIEDFFASGRHLEIGRKYRCRSPQIAVHIDILLRVDGLPVMAGNPIDIGTHNGPRPTLYLPVEPHASLLRALATEGKAGVPFFFCYTPELIYSFFQTRQFVRDLRYFERYECLRRHGGLWVTRIWALRWLFRRDAYQAKVKKYQQAGFQVQARDQKRTGFEQVKVAVQKKTGAPFETAFNELYRRPLEKLNPYPRGYRQILSRQYFPPTTLLEPEG